MTLGTRRSGGLDRSSTGAILSLVRVTYYTVAKLVRLVQVPWGESEALKRRQVCLVAIAIPARAAHLHPQNELIR